MVLALAFCASSSLAENIIDSNTANHLDGLELGLMPNGVVVKYPPKYVESENNGVSGPPVIKACLAHSGNCIPVDASKCSISVEIRTIKDEPTGVGAQSEPDFVPVWPAEGKQPVVKNGNADDKPVEFFPSAWDWNENYWLPLRLYDVRATAQCDFATGVVGFQSEYVTFLVQEGQRGEIVVDGGKPIKSPTTNRKAAFTYSFRDGDGEADFVCQEVFPEGYTKFPRLGRCPDSETGVSFSDLTPGTYRFSIYAVDEEGHAISAPKSITWDVVPLTSTWKIKPKEKQSTEIESYFKISANEKSCYSYVLRKSGKVENVDEGTSCPTENSERMEWYDQSLKGIGADDFGLYTLQVNVLDVYKNEEAPPKIHNWYMDLTAPVVGFDGFGRKGKDGIAITKEVKPKIYFTVDDEGSLVRVGIPTQFPSVSVLAHESSRAAGLSRWVIDIEGQDMSLEPGYHLARLYVENKAGGSVETVFVFRVDNTPPVVSIYSKPEKKSESQKASFRLGSSEPETKFWCSLVDWGDIAIDEDVPTDEAVKIKCAEPLEFVECPFDYSREDLNNHGYSLCVYGEDEAGNPGPLDSWSWRVVARVPADATILEPADESIVETLTPVISGWAELGSTVHVFVDDEPLGKTVATDAATGAFRLPVKLLRDGRHSLRTKVVSSSGNSSAESKNKHTFDVVLPPGSIPEKPSVTGGGVGFSCAAASASPAWLLLAGTLCWWARRPQRRSWPD
ncbi:hypothetical protein [Archangium primigenium]|uniref:hypothetical protein n=1 Tax=[Archangium] primigenium TaxID=2792470 RepID=UPI00195BE4B2|nr:hypothetical protein [Archangium primigenium]MBM7115301.1 hypothetical protein [Archangium primigenium]